MTGTKISVEQSETIESKFEVEEEDKYEDYDNEYSYYDYYEDEKSVNCSQYGMAKQVRKDLANKKCSEFAEEGYRCVPYYACNDGEILTHGQQIISIRGN